ncbi:Mitosis protein dim1 [Colletotrichum orbiculare MAFF 240422]|uniref:Mitosis protein dim1 n=1 Tax=Colletotrichum orbiculare (strain 104-T / ATCC 96160 / CBS 514.97 / LARS 414 / MAFF 240422) TaxID=1213857 RepID=A0A484FB41_COLOR|nr:Mitosis protein dim1 [Colletotrichum orbiculare MAFF 240422]
MGSIVIPHLNSGWHVDQAILSEEERLVVIRFGRDGDSECMRQDEVLYRISDRVKNFAVVYVCDIDQVPDFNQMYELYDPCTIMFFFRNKHMMVDFGTGNNNKLNWSQGLLHQTSLLAVLTIGSAPSEVENRNCEVSILLFRYQVKYSLSILGKVRPHSTFLFVIRHDMKIPAVNT